MVCSSDWRLGRIDGVGCSNGGRWACRGVGGFGDVEQTEEFLQVGWLAKTKVLGVGDGLVLYVDPEEVLQVVLLDGVLELDDVVEFFA